MLKNVKAMQSVVKDDRLQKYREHVLTGQKVAERQRIKREIVREPARLHLSHEYGQNSAGHHTPIPVRILA